MQIAMWTGGMMVSLLGMRNGGVLPALGALLLMTAGVGCSSDEGTPPECVPGQLGQCRGGAFYECTNDAAWELVETCDGSCEPETGCVAVPCTDGDTRCDGRTVQTCEDGVYDDTVVCEEMCSAGACSAGTCEPGGDDCAVGQVCQDGTCVDEGSVCVPGERACDGDDVVECTAEGVLQTVQTCAGSCDSGACACSYDSFTTEQDLAGNFQADIPSSWTVIANGDWILNIAGEDDPDPVGTVLVASEGGGDYAGDPTIPGVFMAYSEEVADSYTPRTFLQTFTINDCSGSGIENITVGSYSGAERTWDCGDYQWYIVMLEPPGEEYALYYEFKVVDSCDVDASEHILSTTTVLADSSPIFSGECDDEFEYVESRGGELQVAVPSSWVAENLLVQDFWVLDGLYAGPQMYSDQRGFSYGATALFASDIRTDQMLSRLGEPSTTLECEALTATPESLEITGYSEVLIETWLCEGIGVTQGSFLTDDDAVLGWFLLVLSGDTECDTLVLGSLLGSLLYIDPALWPTE